VDFQSEACSDDDQGMEQLSKALLNLSGQRQLSHGIGSCLTLILELLNEVVTLT
jgi:hypothetical protein